jgi:hypothetical protein
MMKIDGACHCGAITYEAEVDPDKTSICHCTDCQTLTGAAFRTSVPAAREKFRILSGEPTIYVKTAESGAKRVQAFCGKCGSPIYATALDDPHALYGIRTGTVRQRDRLVPKRQIWTRSAQKWLDRIASLPASEKEPAG